MSLSAEALAASAQALFGYDLKLPAAAQVARPPNTAMARLSALHKAAGDLAVSAPETLARAEVAQAIETELVRAAIGCLTDPVSVREPWTPRLKVMARFEAFVHANEERPLYITDICKGIGVSERTLRLHCLEHLGNQPTPLSLVAAYAPRASGFGIGSRDSDNRYGNCHRSRVLGNWGGSRWPIKSCSANPLERRCVALRAIYRPTWKGLRCPVIEMRTRAWCVRFSIEARSVSRSP